MSSIFFINIFFLAFLGKNIFASDGRSNIDFGKRCAALENNSF
jgi:hypothetical protein